MEESDIRRKHVTKITRHKARPYLYQSPNSTINRQHITEIPTELKISVTFVTKPILSKNTLYINDITPHFLVTTFCYGANFCNSGYKSHNPSKSVTAISCQKTDLAPLSLPFLISCYKSYRYNGFYPSIPFSQLVAAKKKGPGALL